MIRVRLRYARPTKVILAMPNYVVTWSMTGTLQITATDDLAAKELVDALNNDEVVRDSTIQECRVLATHEVKP